MIQEWHAILNLTLHFLPENKPNPFFPRAFTSFISFFKLTTRRKDFREQVYNAIYSALNSAQRFSRGPPYVTASHIRMRNFPRELFVRDKNIAGSQLPLARPDSPRSRALSLLEKLPRVTYSNVKWSCSLFQTLATSSILIDGLWLQRVPGGKGGNSFSLAFYFFSFSTLPLFLSPFLSFSLSFSRACSLAQMHEST